MSRFDDFEEQNPDDDFELDEETIKSIKQAMQDMNDGFGYEWLTDEPGDMVFKCLKCGRTADIHQRPFPHKYNCPMKDHVKD